MRVILFSMCLVNSVSGSIVVVSWVVEWSGESNII